jgi:hypothetical protein
MYRSIILRRAGIDSTVCHIDSTGPQIDGGCLPRQTTLLTAVYPSQKVLHFLFQIFDMSRVISDAPWSAAFISWVMKEANKRAPQLTFPYSAAHVDYATRIRQSRRYARPASQAPQLGQTGQAPFPFDVLNPYVNGKQIELLIGDIVIVNRAGNRLEFSTDPWTGFSHGDIVVNDILFSKAGELVGGNVSNKVAKKTVKNLASCFVVLRPKSQAYKAFIKSIALAEYELWEKNGWTETSLGGRERVALYWDAVGLPYIPPEGISSITGGGAGNAPSAAADTVSPFIASLESFHPSIQYGLTKRRISAETANVYMPFVRLTSLTRVLEKNLQDGLSTAWCPTLGPHGEDFIGFEEMYLPQDRRSIIGYATTSNGNGFSRVPVVVEDSSRDQANIPMPGIVELSTNRGTAGPMGVRGGLMRADIKIRAYSVGQVDALLRYFLRPATRVVMELGRMSASKEEELRPFSWKKSSEEIKALFSDLIYSQEKQRDFINEYVYQNYGNYEIYIGYVVKFNLNVNKNNVYELSLTVHSVQQFEVPTTHTGVKALCPDAVNPCKVCDVREYFTQTSDEKPNSFSKLMSATENDNEWKSQRIPINLQTEGDDVTEYYVSWRFFVEKILNDETYGIASVVNDENARRFVKLGLLRPTREPTQDEAGIVDGELIANQVGYHPHLRSTDPNVIIINNQTAQTSRTQEEKDAFSSVLTDAKKDQKVDVGNPELYNTIVSGPSFRNRVSDADNQKAAVGYLTDGVWINTKAIKQAFSQSDTISAAINTLLVSINGATEGYWNLQVYSSDRPNPGMYVIDMALSKRPTTSVVDEQGNITVDPELNSSTDILDSIYGVNLDRYYKSSTESDKPKYIYMFNRGTLVLPDGELGSDIVDMKVEFNLPQVIAVQAIAGVGGPAQKSTLQSIDIPELQQITLLDNIIATCNKEEVCLDRTCPPAGKEAKELAEANEILAGTIRKMNNGSLRGLGGARALLDARAEQRRAREAYNLAATKERLYADVNKTVSQIREVLNLGDLLELIEFSPTVMLKKLNIDSTNVEEGRIAPYAHSFNSSNLTKTTVSVTLPGVGGIELFQSFYVDRVPSILERGFYVVTKVVHKFAADSGWLTTIEGRFRFRPDQPSQPSATPTYEPNCGPFGQGNEFSG